MFDKFVDDFQNVLDKQKGVRGNIENYVNKENEGS